MISHRYTKSNLVQLIEELKTKDVLAFIKDPDIDVASFKEPADLAEIACALLAKLVGNGTPTEENIQHASQALTEIFLPLLKGLDTQLLEIFIDEIITRMGNNKTLMSLMIELVEKSQPTIRTYSDFFDLTKHFDYHITKALLAKQDILFQPTTSLNKLSRHHDAGSLKIVLENYISPTETLSWLHTVQDDVTHLNDAEFLNFLLTILKSFIPTAINYSAKNILNQAMKLPDSIIRTDLIELIEHTLDKCVVTAPLKIELATDQVKTYLGECHAYSWENDAMKVDHRIDIINQFAALAYEELKLTVIVNQENLNYYHLQCSSLLQSFAGRLSTVTDFTSVKKFLNDCQLLDSHVANLDYECNAHQFAITLKCAALLHSAVTTGDQVAAIAAIIPAKHRLAYIEANNEHWRPKQDSAILHSPAIEEVFSVEPLSIFSPKSPPIDHAPVMPTTPRLGNSSKN